MNAEPRAITSTWKSPPRDVVAIVDAPGTPVVAVEPTGKRVLIAAYRDLPTIEEIARPVAKLAGHRFDPVSAHWQRTWHFTGFTIVDVDSSSRVELEIPTGARLGRPLWSPRGGRIVFTNETEHGVELWLSDPTTGASRRLLGPVVHQALGDFVRFLPDGSGLTCLVRVDAVKQHVAARVRGPVVEDTAGRAATNRTFQDLLKDATDDAEFRAYATARFARVDFDGTLTELGDAGIFLDAAASPDGRFLLIERALEPFSHVVPLHRFARTVEVWDRDGKLVRELARLPAADEVPIQGVPTGARAVSWQPLRGATLVWAEAQDGGDPRQPAEFRDRLFALDAPFDGVARAIDAIKERFIGLDWTERPGEAFVTDWHRDTRFATTRQIVVDGKVEPRTLFHRSVDDRYGDPGEFVHVRGPDGLAVARVEDGCVWLAGDGATPQGNRPFLDRLDLSTRASSRVWSARDGRYESFVQFVARAADGARRFVIRTESPSEPPNYALWHERDGELARLTHEVDPHPQLSGVTRELVTYARADGVPLSGTLLMPRERAPGQRLRLVIHAYPTEFADVNTAGQVNAAPTRFTRLLGTSPAFFLARGYAVLEQATIPIVGPPETVNDTFIAQVVAAAEAAIDALDARGVIDPGRVGVIGHSYGALMVATLLAHSGRIGAGIARSGAYNRTLTPFGYQNERRTLWQAKHAYLENSPFLFADRIKKPLLLIHGADDENPGTFPLQSQRLFHALAGLGGTARLVVLPHEGHGYSARESVLHVLAEQFDWFDKHLEGGASEAGGGR
ncbi:MAG: S9 family peptidase [Planctomycetes bacterium]|nr:S9 family peptidase [Planctomycetota bacterium]MCC7173221.1 S9 family peptidase [Planctomycetota bacterium]